MSSPVAAASARPPRVPVVGLVGGIGSGKSAVARWVAAHHPVVVVDADALGHAALADAAVREELRRAFGPDIFDADGQVRRAALAARVFGESADQQSARRTLEAIIHPHIKAEFARVLATVDPQRTCAVLLDAAVLLEAGWRDVCLAVVFVDAPESARRQRVAERSGWSGEELARREASQWPLDRKRAASDYVLVNDRSLETAGQRLWEFLQSVARLHGEKLPE